jgi:D-alanyl-lipoteichoic acid acyltransferase DltB (MBOAT superfamily)
MVFSSTLFLFLFFPLVLLFYYNPLCKSRNYRNNVLLAGSIFFYAWGEPFFVFIMFFSILVNWFFTLWIDKYEDKKRRKRCLVLLIVWNVSLFFVFKYLSFVLRNVNYFLKDDRLAVNIALPIGISFFTFQIMSYVLDVYYRKARMQKSFINTALYISLFPQLIAGPIVRYETVAGEIGDRKETFEDFIEGESRFIIGLSKKLLIADYMGLVVDKIFALNGELSVASAWLGGIAYTIQIYFDFSGYSDMAIGLGRMFGFHFHENFNYPFIATTITDYWKRWHISLSSWFRDYLFYPLVLRNRESKGWIVLSLFLVWLLTGIWHGANWTCVSYGVFYFVLLAIERFTGLEKRLRKSRVLSRFYVLFFVIINFVIFRSENIVLAGQYLGAMFGIGAAGLVDDVFFLYLSNCKWILLAGILLSTPLVRYCKNKWAGERGRIYQFLSSVGLMVLFCLALFVCINSDYSPFIYFNF